MNIHRNPDYEYASHHNRKPKADAKEISSGTVSDKKQIGHDIKHRPAETYKLHHENQALRTSVRSLRDMELGVVEMNRKDTHETTAENAGASNQGLPSYSQIPK